MCAAGASISTMAACCGSAKTLSASLIEAGIECPAGFVAFSDWCESIGVPQFVHRLIMRHHSSRGTSPSPYERMGARQHRMLRRLQTD